MVSPAALAMKQSEWGTGVKDFLLYLVFTFWILNHIQVLTI